MLGAMYTWPTPKAWALSPGRSHLAQGGPWGEGGPGCPSPKGRMPKTACLACSGGKGPTREGGLARGQTIPDRPGGRLKAR